MPLSEKATRSKDRSFKIPDLQHRHFAFIAGCIRGIPTPSARVEATKAFVGYLCRSNPAFNSYRFRDACDCAADSMTLEDLDLAIVHATYWLDHLQQERLARGIADQKVEG
jgi:hypothetical protein